MLTQTQSHLTIVELVSRKPNMAESIEAGAIIRDYLNLELYSDRPLFYQEIAQAAAKHPAFSIVGINHIGPDSPDEF
jgi:hypothetical protein